MARIFIVEDDEAIRGELGELLRKNGHEPLAATTFDNVAGQIIDAAPDLVLLDLNLPVADGHLVCREVRASSSVPIIVLTSRTGEIDEVMSMSLGADDFIAKPYSPHVLLARVEALLRRVSHGYEGTKLEHKGVVLDVSRSVVSANGKSVELTKNEMRILSVLMRADGAIVPRETIMCELWDSDAFVDDNTLTVNVNRLRSALERIGVKDYLVTHRGQGYSV